MKNRYFAEEEIRSDDLFFICYMVERIARKLRQRNRYVVNTIGKEEMYHLIFTQKILWMWKTIGLKSTISKRGILIFWMWKMNWYLKRQMPYKWEKCIKD